MEGSGRHYDEVAVGDTFRRSLTVTDTHLVIGAGLIGDFNPHHVDDAYASETRFGTRILHGMLTSAMMGGALGMIFHGTAIALLEHATRFVSPVRPGDTIATTWTVTGKTDKPAKGGGVVTLKAIAVNQVRARDQRLARVALATKSGDKSGSEQSFRSENLL
jgi:acyl dehydratase